jgi:hypothetical protein
MMIGLESGTTFTLHNDNDCVKDLVELGKIEDPSPESKALIPDPTNVGTIRQAIATELDELILDAPRVAFCAECGSIAQTPWTVHLAKRIDRSNQRVMLGVMRYGDLEGAYHGSTGDCGIGREEDIVQNDKSPKCTRLADSPWFIPISPVHPIEIYDGRSVDCADRCRHTEVKGGVVDVVRNREWRPEGRLFERWRNRSWAFFGGKLEQRPRGEAPRKERRSCARHIDDDDRPSLSMLHRWPRQTWKKLDHRLYAEIERNG